MSALTNVEVLRDLEQGTAEWLSLRTTKITSTDAAVIVGASHWKTRIQLYNEKISDTPITTFVNDRMKRGTDLEPIARQLFCIQNGVEVYPRVVTREWAMASLDGMSDDGKHIVEIKCPGEKDHACALAGRVPDHYYPQLQHQLYVTGLQSIFYYSFDGTDGVTIVVKRDDAYIEKMVEQEKIFYDCLINKTPPEPSENDYVEREDELWSQCAQQWKYTNEQIKSLEKEEEHLRKQLIFLSGASNVRGGGLSLCRVIRSGHIDYSKIPELRGVDLDKYRKPSIDTWRITTH
jgi:putative phage-type endonuclease